MDSELDQAYYGVYRSSKEIIKNKQRHLYCNMLDLLTSTGRAAVLSGTSIIKADMVKFWLREILPLMFDNERTVQSSAIAAVEQSLVSLDLTMVHNDDVWPEIKSVIVSTYAQRINKLRDEKNPNWGKLWCILIQILDRELLKGASIINTYLAIVELGFRSSDNNVRADSFLCWRLLIKVFAAYDELTSAKRLKLICIPLKSSQSKSSHAASVKLRVWWYLITCLGDRLDESYGIVIDPFLTFTFGVSNRGAPCAVHQYAAIREIALPSITALWCVEPNEMLQRSLQHSKLEMLEIPSPLMTPGVLTLYWKPLLNAVMEAIKLIIKSDSEAEHQLLQILVRNLVLVLFRMDSAPLSAQICNELIKLITAQPTIVSSVFNTIATENLYLKRGLADADEYKNVLDAFMKLFMKASAHVAASILSRCVGKIFDTEMQTDFRHMSNVLELVLTNNDDDNYVAFEAKLLIWRKQSQDILDYLRSNSLEYRLKDSATILDKWILWPLKTYIGFAGKHSDFSFDVNPVFSDLWRQLLYAGHNAPERKQFLADVKTTLHELLINRKALVNFAELFHAYVTAAMKLDFNKDAILQRDLFALMNQTITTPEMPQKTIEGCLNTLRHFIIGLKNNELTMFFERLKSILSTVVRNLFKEKLIETGFQDEWKRAIQDKLRTHPDKNFANQVKELFKGNDVFIIIPSVWSLNPEKLTDRQKERFAEKADIPALYNDMSQSQDSSIKPWTPKKIVIAKNNQTEIVIEGADKTAKEPQLQEPASEVVAFLTPSVNTLTTATMPSIPTNSAKRASNTILNKPAKKLRASNEGDAQKLPTESGSSSDESKPPTRVTRRRSTICLDMSTAKSDTVDKKIRKSPKKQSSISPEQKITIARDLFADPKQTTTTTTSAELTSGNTLIENDMETELQAQTEPIVQENNVATEVVATKVVEEAEKITKQIVIPEIVAVQELSPKKSTTKFTGLTSPPDRKLTNNSSSPTLRHKPSTHLTGRAAQFINIARNRKLEISSPYPLNAAVSKLAHMTPGRYERSDNTAAAELMELTGTDQTSTPIQSKDLLIFSKRLPSPTASPSASILKQKLLRDSLDDISIDSPGCKQKERKRVSFHDPPVSATKEYMRDTDENKTKPKRCLVLDKADQGQGMEPKHLLRRRSKLDSIIEIEKFGSDHAGKAHNECATSSATKIADKSDSVHEDSSSIGSLKWNDSRNSTSNQSCINTSGKSIAETERREHTAIIDADTALNIVTQQCSLDVILEKYFSAQNGLLLKNANVLAKFVSQQMSTNAKIKTNVLETLSENHSKDFLDHAVQENLSSVVCDRLNLNSVIDYIFAKSAINTNCRNNLLQQVSEMLKNSKLDLERMSFIKNILGNSNMTDENILDIITHLMSLRAKNEVIVGSLSESAVDSSSNL